MTGIVNAIINSINSIIAIPLLDANPTGVLGAIIPVTCSIIPKRPIIEPPATRPEDKLIPFATFTSLSLLFLLVFSINTRIRAPTKIMLVVDIGK